MSITENTDNAIPIEAWDTILFEKVLPLPLGRHERAFGTQRRMARPSAQFGRSESPQCRLRLWRHNPAHRPAGRSRGNGERRGLRG